MTSLLIPAELDLDALDAEVAELFAEVDAILCAAVTLDPRQSTPPVAAYAPLRTRRGPARPVRAVQRSPPTSPEQQHN